MSALTISLIESDWYRSFSTNNTVQKKFNSKLHSSEQLMNSMENSEFISKQRPIFAKHQIFIHFCNGLSISGLPSNRKLNEILQNWLNLLTIQLDNICNCNDILRKLFNEMKSSFSVNKISSNIDLK
ncbi:unnamed protein product [Schistosoma mattheei]|uniref:Uncharacterized protein n=1 Tax=Schistosoma mattheei TaxID=31246 RepID=A0A3P7ZR44_9TREM|nr:unnamed protein product [Schistosoma mattheei]